MANVCCDSLLLIHSANFSKGTFVFVRHRLCLVRQFCAPSLAALGGGAIAASAPLIMLLEYCSSAILNCC